MFTEYWMSPKIGPVSYGHDGFRGQGGGFLYPGASSELSDDLAALIDEETSRLVNEAHGRATEVLTRHRGLLDQLSKILIFNEVIDGEDLQAYFDGPPPAAEAARMVIHKAMCDLLWTLWGVIQHVNDNPADDFWAYAVGRFERCRTLMATERFRDSVERFAGN